MARYRRVEQYAGMYVIKLLPIDIKDLNLKLGDLVDIEDAVRKTSLSEEVHNIFNKTIKEKKKK